MAVYSSVEEVKVFTGILYTDLRLASEAALNSLIEGWLIQAKNFIDTNRNRDYDADGDIPAGINNIALRIAANMAAQAVIRQETPIVKQEDYSLKTSGDSVFTSSIREDLRNYPAKPRFRMAVVSTEEVTDE